MTEWGGPGAGWQEVSDRAYRATSPSQHLMYHNSETGIARFWLRNAPPVFPTEPHTVIRATWLPGGESSEQGIYALSDRDGKWTSLTSGIRYTPGELRYGLTEFTVLTKPKSMTLLEHETAIEQEVTERVRRETIETIFIMLELMPCYKNIRADIGREYGVEA